MPHTYTYTYMRLHFQCPKSWKCYTYFHSKPESRVLQLFAYRLCLGAFYVYTNICKYSHAPHKYECSGFDLNCNHCVVFQFNNCNRDRHIYMWVLPFFIFIKPAASIEDECVTIHIFSCLPNKTRYKDIFATNVNQVCTLYNHSFHCGMNILFAFISLSNEPIYIGPQAIQHFIEIFSFTNLVLPYRVLSLSSVYSSANCRFRFVYTGRHTPLWSIHVLFVCVFFIHFLSILFLLLVCNPKCLLTTYYTYFHSSSSSCAPYFYFSLSCESEMNLLFIFPIVFRCHNNWYNNNIVKPS